MSIRHLLTMTAGFPTDDPWGDRQQGLPLEEFGRFLAGGVRVQLGAGHPVRVLQPRLRDPGPGHHRRHRRSLPGLHPAPPAAPARHDPHRLRGRGVRDSRPADTAAGGLARGYRRGGPAAGPRWRSTRSARSPRWAGSSAACATSARWVAGFAAAFPPGGTRGRRRASAPARHPAGDAAPQVLDRLGPPAALPRGRGARGCRPTASGCSWTSIPPWAGSSATAAATRGSAATCAGIRPSGTGVIALGNSTYAAMTPLAARLLEAVLRHRERPRTGYGVALAPAAATGARGRRRWPRGRRSAACCGPGTTPQAAAAVLAQRGPGRPVRGTAAGRSPLVRERIGDFRDDAGPPPEFDTPAHCRWWLAGERGVVQAQIQLNPERPPRVQSLTLAVPPAAGSAAGRHAGRGPGRLAERHATATGPPAVPVAGTRGRRPAGPPPADGRRLGRPVPPRRLPGGRRRRLGRGRTARRARHA